MLAANYLDNELSRGDYMDYRPAGSSAPASYFDSISEDQGKAFVISELIEDINARLIPRMVLVPVGTSTTGKLVRSKQILQQIFVTDPEPFGLMSCTLSPAPSATAMVGHDTQALDARIRKLVEEQKIKEAQVVLTDFKYQAGILGPELAAWARLLAPPRFQKSTKGTGVDRRKAMLELKKTADKYKNEWVALDENGVIGHDKNKVELYKSLKAIDKVKGSLFVYVD